MGDFHWNVSCLMTFCPCTLLLYSQWDICIMTYSMVTMANGLLQGSPNPLILSKFLLNPSWYVLRGFSEPCCRLGLFCALFYVTMNIGVFLFVFTQKWGPELYAPCPFLVCLWEWLSLECLDRVLSWTVFFKYSIFRWLDHTQTTS